MRDVRRVRVDRCELSAAELAGGVLARDLAVGGARWSKGRRLTLDDARLVLTAPVAAATVLLLDPDDVHEDEAALRLATAVVGSGLELRGPAESRVDLLAAVDGVTHVHVAALERINRLPSLEVFTLLHGQPVVAGEPVASVKIAPIAVERSVLETGVALAGRAAPVVRVAPFVPRRVAVVSEESVRRVDRDRFEASIRLRVESLGSSLVSFHYVAADPMAVAGALRPHVLGPGRADVILTAGAASTDPGDPMFEAVEALGGRILRHGAPAHPGSMAWLARVGRTDLLGLPACGHYSRATSADLILPRLLTGERASARMVAELGHGGLLGRAMRFRFPAYAQQLEPPGG